MPEEGEPMEERAPGTIIGQTRVLVVDDNPGAREMVLRVLRRYGWQAEGAADGLEALARLLHGEFDVIVSDFQMPRLDGLGLLREARRLTDPPPLIIQTTMPNPALEILLMDAGAFGVVMKGAPIADLVGSIEAACAVAHAAGGSRSLRRTPPIPSIS
jgi:CheY-like chemotaxis protein